MKTLAQLCFDRRDISLRWTNYKEIIHKDCDVYALAVVEYTVIGYKGFETEGFKVGRKGEILDTRRLL